MRFITIFCAFLMSLFCGIAFANPLDLVLTQGVSSPIPIAVVPFSGQSDPQASNNVSAVVNADLANSGQFKTVDSSAMAQTPHTASDVDAVVWKNAKVNAVVVGNVTQQGGSYKVDFALVNVYNTAGPQTLAQQSFTVPANDLRKLAHHISDIIYQQLTGTKGIFSTHVAYVLAQRAQGIAPKFTLEVADIDGYNPLPLLSSKQPIMSPAWSHDGNKIAYVTFENVTPQIFVQNVATGSRHAVTSFPGINGAPAWSPDDSKLALVLSKNGAPKIYILDLGSQSLTQVTHGPSIDTEPSWMPDGKSLIFTSDRGGGPQIYQLNIASGQVQRLTFSGSYNARGSITPDGQSLVMIHRAQGEEYGIAAQDLQSGTIRVLSRSGFDTSPSVAPNGRMVLFESDASQRGILGMVSIDGKVRLKIPAAGGSVEDPAWSPFLG